MNGEIPAGASAVRSSVPWTWVSHPCVALQHHFVLRIESSDSSIRETMEPIVAPFVTQHPGEAGETHQTYDVRRGDDPERPLALFAGEHLLASGRDATQLVRALTWRINRSVIAESVDHHVLLHAGAAHRDGVTVLLPGDQEHGKTTTIGALLRAGFDYLTDEAAALDPGTGAVTPFPKTLTLDRGSWHLFPELAPFPCDVPQRHVHPRELGAKVLPSRAPAPRVVIFPRYVAGSITGFEPLSPGQAAVRLAQCTFAFPAHAARNLATLGRVASRAIAGTLVIDRLDAALEIIEQLVDEAQPRSTP